MRFLLSVLTLLRSPMKTLVTFVLLLATSFAFVSRGAEYAATLQATSEAEAAYSAVGTVQMTESDYLDYPLMMENHYPSSVAITKEMVDLVNSSEYVETSEVRLVAGGRTSNELWNVVEQPLFDVPGYSEWNWGITLNTFEMDSGLVIASYDYGAIHRVDEVVIGHPDFFRENQELFVQNTEVNWEAESPDFLTRDDPEWNSAVYSQMWQEGHRYLMLLTDEFSVNDKFKKLNDCVEYPLVDLTVLEEEYGVTDYREALRNPDKYGLAEFYAGQYEATETVEYLETLDRNFHTQDVVFTDSMENLMKYHSGELYIAEGRAITAADAGNVCVVSANYAEYNGLAVGDSIEFELSADNMAHSAKVFGREVPFEHRPGIIWNEGELQDFIDYGLEPVTKTYEIVGIWSDSTHAAYDPFSYAINTVFVPDDTYPWAGEVEPHYYPSTFSFALAHPGDMAKIEAELGDRLAAMGYELSIDDMGYAEAKPNFEFMKLSALIGFVAMSLALLLSLILITYLFIIRKKHDYAIMRALGTTRSRSNNSLLVGLFALAIPAVFLGSLLALALTQGFAADLSAQISEITGSATASTMPAWLVGAFGAGVLGLLLAFARAGLVRVGRTPPLALLQGR